MVTKIVEFENVGELEESLGRIEARRIRMKPYPGTATEADLIRANDRKGVLCELVNGTLVEKVMGYGEGGLESDIIRILGRYLDVNDIGDVVSASAMMRLSPGVVRLPDVSVVLWEQLPGRRRPTAPIPDIYPDLAVEVLSEGNTRDEMFQKRRHYFFAGTRLVWEVDPRRFTISVYNDPETRTILTEADTLTGGDVLPGFSVPVREVFARVPRPEPKPRRKKK
ncbi:MAG: Uma2 family endonuclease [Gemmataceae bacterium]|nr:Uma2 family endonuclease [Gemmataceae bacterium]